MSVYVCVSQGHINPNYCHWNGGLKSLFSECNVSLRKIYADIDSNDLSDDQYCGNSNYNFYGVILPPSRHQTILSWIRDDESTMAIPLYIHILCLIYGYENVILHVWSIPDSVVGHLFVHFVWEDRLPIMKNILHDKVVLLL